MYSSNSKEVKKEEKARKEEEKAQATARKEEERAAKKAAKKEKKESSKSFFSRLKTKIKSLQFGSEDTEDMECLATSDDVLLVGETCWVLPVGEMR